MATNTSISLDEHFTTFMKAQVATGRYASVSDVVRSGLRLLEEHEARVAALKAALDEGERSGIADEFSFDEFLTARRQ